MQLMTKLQPEGGLYGSFQEYSPNTLVAYPLTYLLVVCCLEEEFCEGRCSSSDHEAAAYCLHEEAYEDVLPLSLSGSLLPMVTDGVYLV
ncbi:hypothetical protein TREES_T100014954 [Tupaia chinensis]|uniref:Uncharacterized protein n=1 Tax=Tupaia chinensis TaxID=246437 RepID=L9KP21_TUPCH|nr:hypothetical protein TREES_T100014954 [Tupaia chinensis]